MGCASLGDAMMAQAAAGTGRRRVVRRADGDPALPRRSRRFCGANSPGSGWVMDGVSIEGADLRHSTGDAGGFQVSTIDLGRLLA